MALEGIFRLFVLVPVQGARRVSFDKQVADYARLHRLSVFIQDFSFITGNDLTAGAGPHCTGPVRDEHVQDFGRADGVEYLDAKPIFEAMENAGRQGFTGRDSIAYGGEIAIGAVALRLGKQCSKVRRNGKE